MYCPDCGRQDHPRTALLHAVWIRILEAISRLIDRGGAGGPLEACSRKVPGPPRHSARVGSLGDLATMMPAGQLSTLEPGYVVGGQYVIQELLGRGGMGTVYRVVDRDLGEECAIKILHPHLVANERAIERFTTEAALRGDWRTQGSCGCTTLAGTRVCIS